jgi:hypothetical protein
MTALHHACNSGPDGAEKIKLLLDEGGANIDALNKAGESPLRLAINCKGAFSATARCLQDRGGIDQGPRPRQTSPVRWVNIYAMHEWTPSQPQPVRQATRFAAPQHQRTVSHPLPGSQATRSVPPQHQRMIGSQEGLAESPGFSISAFGGTPPNKPNEQLTSFGTMSFREQAREDEAGEAVYKPRSEMAVLSQDNFFDRG